MAKIKKTDRSSCCGAAETNPHGLVLTRTWVQSRPGHMGPAVSPPRGPFAYSRAIFVPSPAPLPMAGTTGDSNRGGTASPGVVLASSL